MPDDLATPEAVSAWGEVSSNTLHKTSPKGITCLDLHPTKPNLVCKGKPAPRSRPHDGSTSQKQHRGPAYLPSLSACELSYRAFIG